MADPAAALAAAGEVGSAMAGVAGLDAVVDVVVVGPGKAERHAALTVVGGRVTAAVEGAPDAPDVTFTLAAADAAALADGGVAPTVAFMRGRLKTAGDPGLVLALLAAADAGPFARWVDALRAG